MIHSQNQLLADPCLVSTTTMTLANIVYHLEKAVTCARQAMEFIEGEANLLVKQNLELDKSKHQKSIKDNNIKIDWYQVKFSRLQNEVDAMTADLQRYMVILGEDTEDSAELSILRWELDGRAKYTEAIE